MKELFSKEWEWWLFHLLAVFAVIATFFLGYYIGDKDSITVQAIQFDSTSSKYYRLSPTNQGITVCIETCDSLRK